MVANASYEDLFYILAGLLWLAFSIYNANNKKKKGKESQGRKSKEKEQPDFLETLMNEFGIEQKQQYDESDNEPYQPYTYDEQELITKTSNSYSREAEPAIEEQEVFSYDDIYEESNYTEITDVIEKKKSHKNYDNTNLEKVKSTKKKSRKVDLKRAVIYSEILNRRYF